MRGRERYRTGLGEGLKDGRTKMWERATRLETGEEHRQPNVLTPSLQLKLVILKLLPDNGRAGLSVRLPVRACH